MNILICFGFGVTWLLKEMLCFVYYSASLMFCWFSSLNTHSKGTYIGSHEISLIHSNLQSIYLKVKTEIL